MRRSLQFLGSGTLGLRVSTSPVMGHDQGRMDAHSWLLWAKLSVFVLGAICLAAGVYIDQIHETRVKHADYLVVTGVVLLLVGGVSLY